MLRVSTRCSSSAPSPVLTSKILPGDLKAPLRLTPGRGFFFAFQRTAATDLPCLAKPGLAQPCPDSHAVPSLASSRLASTATPRLALPSHALPCPAAPCPAS